MSLESRYHGMAAITVVAIGQLVSQIGSGMTVFAVIYWVWQKSGQAFDVTLLAAVSYGPLYLLTPLAGALVDRWDRKTVMIASDLAAALASAGYLALFAFGRLEIASILVITAFSGAFRAFQMPAYSAAVTMMVDKKDYARVSGILSLPQSTSLVIAPLLAGALFGLIGLDGILVFDLLTFIVSVVCLARIHVPKPPRSSEDMGPPRGLGSEMAFGWHYIRDRPPLLGLLVALIFFNFYLMLSISLLPPMILARTGNDELVLGMVQSLMGVGGLTGAVGLGISGGFRRHVYGVLIGILGASFLTGVVMGLSATLLGWCVGGFFGAMMIPVINGSSQAIWQAKVAPGVQGRVFAVRRVLGQVSSLPAFLIAGPAADLVFEPAMREGGAGQPLFGFLVGTGPGAGMSLIFVISGLFGSLVAALAFFTEKIRRVEDLLPDHSSADESGAADVSLASGDGFPTPPPATTGTLSDPPSEDSRSGSVFEPHCRSTS